MRKKANPIPQSAFGWSNPSLKQAAEIFFDVGMLSKSPKTKIWYQRRIEPMVKHIGPDRPLENIVNLDLLRWMSSVRGRDTLWGGNSTHPATKGSLSPSYIFSIVRATKFFFSWLVRTGALPASPAEILELPNLPKAGRKGISDDDAADILRALDSNRLQVEDRILLRDTALIRFVEATGCRLGGAVSLTRSNLCLTTKQATVIEKNNKERPVFFDEKTANYLGNWLEVRGQKEEHVFIGKIKPLTTNGVYQIFERWANAAEVEENWSPHQWRHRFGRRCAQLGMPLSTIAQLMGHENVSVTHRFYSIFSTNELKAAYEKYL